MQWNVRRSKLLLVGGIGVLVCALSSTGCGNGDDDGDHEATASGDAGTVPIAMTGAETGTTADGAALLSDGQIFQIVHLANQGEIAEAEMAQRQAEHASVRGVASAIDFSQELVDAQLEGYAEMANLTAVDSAESTSLAATTTADETALGALGGAAFDSAYLAAQVKAHQSILDLIDSELLPETGAPILQTLVQDTRALIATHLVEIQALQSDAGPAS